MSTTLAVYRQAILHKLQDRVVFPSVGVTTSAGTASQIIDTANLADTGTDPAPDSTRYVGMWAYLLLGGYAGQTVNEARLVTTYTPGTGILVPAYAFGGTTKTASAYELHKFLHPADLERLINETLRNRRYQALTPLTLITDGDMELSAVTWTASGAGATPTKVTTAANVYSGERSLRVLNTVANSYAYSNSVPVTEADTYLVGAIAMTASGTAKLVAWNVTGGTEIDSWTCDEKEWFEFCETVTIPSGCKQMRLHLQGVEATADIYWDCAILLPSNARIVDAPTWITREDHLEEVYYFPASSTVASDSDGRWVKRSDPVRWGGFNLLPDTMGQHQYRIRLSPAVGNRVPWLLGSRPYAALSVDADTSQADLDDIVDATVMRVWELLGPDYVKEYSLARGKVKPQRPHIDWRTGRD